jgi:hypothetical protein
MKIKISLNEKGNPPGKAADAELHFTDGPLDGLKLIGFAVWKRRIGNGLNVTFPARQYSINGERRSFALLRPIVDPFAQDRIRDLIINAYTDTIERAAERDDDMIAQTISIPSAPSPAPEPTIAALQETTIDHKTNPAPHDEHCTCNDCLHDFATKQATAIAAMRITASERVSLADLINRPHRPNAPHVSPAPVPPAIDF